MVLHCVAFGCTNEQDGTKPITFHRLPFKRPKILDLWMKALHRKNWTPSQNSRLCSDHFVESDYRIFPGSQLKLLKLDAVPSVFCFSERTNNIDGGLQKKKLKLKDDLQQSNNLTALASFDLEEEDDNLQALSPTTTDGNSAWINSENTDYTINNGEIVLQIDEEHEIEQDLGMKLKLKDDLQQSNNLTALASFDLEEEDDNLQALVPTTTNGNSAWINSENTDYCINNGEIVLQIHEKHETEQDLGIVDFEAFKLDEETQKQKGDMSSAEEASSINGAAMQLPLKSYSLPSPQHVDDCQSEPIQISEHLCRLCLKEEPGMWSLFSVLTFDDHSTLDVSQAFQRLTKESSEDIEKPGVPKYICQKCVNLLINAHDFYELYEKSNHTLMEYLTISNTKANNTQETTDEMEFKIEPLDYSYEDKVDAINIEQATKHDDDLLGENIAEPIDVQITEIDNTRTNDDDNNKEAIQFHSCPICLKRCSALELKQHCRSHVALKSYLNAAPRFNRKVRFYAHPRTNKVCLFYRKNVTHICPYCAEEFTGEQFKEHVKQHRLEGNFRCNICNRIFMGRNHLKLHQLSHKQEATFKCQECGKGFFKQKNFNFHKLTHTKSNDLPFRCEHCFKAFSNPEHLKRHIFSHEKLISYQQYYRRSKSYISCKDCLQKFRSKEELDDHSCKFCCAKCHKIFENKKEFTAHVCKHKLKPMQCQTCLKVFQLPSSFHAHKSSCSKQTLCSKCGKHVSNITQHLQTHLPQKSTFFTCAQCGKQFKFKVSLNQHINEVHLNVIPFRCQYCSRGFQSKWNLAMHERIHLGLKKHACDVCGKAFLEKSYLQRHSRVHLKSVSEEKINR